MIWKQKKFLLLGIERLGGFEDKSDVNLSAGIYSHRIIGKWCCEDASGNTVCKGERESS
jgi:hypothetical protein